MTTVLLRVGLMAWLLWGTLAAAQPYPSKPVRLLVPFPPGGSTDLVARTFSPRFAELLGQQVVIEYKGGAGGSIGAAEVARAPADGYSLLVVWDTHGVNHHVYKVAYDPFRSFEHISLLVQAPGILVATPSFPPSTVRELTDYATANPERVTYASAGTGSSNHLSALLFSKMAGIRMTHVPYKGGGPIIADLIGGHVQILFGSLPLFTEHVRSGKMKALAVLSRERLAQFPNIPAAAETLPGFEARTWFGFLAPAGTPREIITRLNQDVVRALSDPKVKEAFSSRGFDVVASTPEAFAAFVKRESDTWGALIREAGIRAE